MLALNAYRASRCQYVYTCIVSAGGGFQVGPEGWTVTKTANGVYLVTHSLGHQRYAAIPAALVAADSSVVAVVKAWDSNTITVNTYATAALADHDFGLIVMTTQ